MNAAKRRRIGYTTIVLAILAFIVAIMASNTLLRGTRFDLTENNLYTLSDGSKAVLADIDEPITLYLFFSDSESSALPLLRSYAKRVHEMLDEMAASANGQITIKVIDPEPFSKAEDRANQFGLRAINLGSKGQNIYLGIAGTNGVGDSAKIPFLQPSKESFLEYDLMRMIYSLAHPKKPVVGLISGVSMSGGFNSRTRKVTPPWVITKQVKQLFDLRTLPKSVDKIDKDIDVLWLVHPSNLDDKTLYAIDQFVLGGGRALVFVDPLAEIASKGRRGAAAAATGASSNLARLFNAWGVEYSPKQVITDNKNALSVSMGYGQRPVRHIGLLGIGAAGLDQKDVVTAGLDSVNFDDAGVLSKADGAKVTFSPLITTSAQSDLMPISKMRFVGNPTELLDSFVASGNKHVLAARLSGHIDTAFPNGPPTRSTASADNSTATASDSASESDKSKDGTEGADTASPQSNSDTNAAATTSTSLKSTDDAHIIVVADVDLLSNRMWVQQQNFLGQPVETAFANNGDFIVNALDNLSGSAELIGLKSRPAYARPFTTVEALRRKADAHFRAKQQQLQAELQQTEKKLSALQATRHDKTSLLMSPAQKKEVKQFIGRRNEIREQLRAVQHSLNEDIEQLGTNLKIINIIIMPLLLTLIVFFLFYVRRRRHGA